jgi:hypothetical protein
MSRLRALLLALLLFPAGLLLHELSHLGLLFALGGRGALIVRPWRFETLPLALPSLHVTGAATLALPGRLLFDLGGPGLIGLAALLLAWRAGGSLRPALAANAFVLFFFALIETADVLLERTGADLGLLTWEEFNYGIPLLVILFATATATTIPRREVAG